MKKLKISLDLHILDTTSKEEVLEKLNFLRDKLNYVIGCPYISMESITKTYNKLDNLISHYEKS